MRDKTKNLHLNKLTELLDGDLTRHMDVTPINSTLGPMTHLLVDRGYVVKYILNEELTESLSLPSNVIELKINNNGGFWYTENKDGSVTLTARISVRGQRVELDIPLSSVYSIMVLIGMGEGSDHEEHLVELGSILAHIALRKYQSLFLKTNSVTDVKQVDRLGGSNNVSYMSDYFKKPRS